MFAKKLLWSLPVAGAVGAGIGVDYWLAPNAVFKVGYEFDEKKIGRRQNGFLAQFGFGL